MARSLPQLSRFELQVLRLLWTRSEASVSDLHGDIPDAPSYSTIRKIVERLESKGAIERVRVDGQAVVYRAATPRTTVISRRVTALKPLLSTETALTTDGESTTIGSR